jgi:hypothetical protein
MPERRFSKAKPTGLPGLNHRRVRSWFAKYGLLIVAMFIGSLSRVMQLGFPVSGPYEFRQAQTAFAVRGLVQGEGSPLFSYLPVFGDADQVPFEFPIFQMAAAQIALLGGTEAFSGRFVSFFMFQISAILTWILAKYLFGLAAANIGLLVFQFSPFGMIYGASFLIESTALGFTMMSIIVLEFSRRRGIGALVPLAIGFAIVAFLVKITTPIGWFVGYFVYLLILGKIKWTLADVLGKFGPVTLVGLLGVLSGIVWSELANQVKRLHPITDQLTSSNLQSWNFGTIEQRLDLVVYFKLATTPVLLILGISLLLIVPAVFTIRGTYEWKPVLSLSLVAFSNIFLFMNLYFVHEYYFMAVYPALSSLAGWVVSRAALFFRGNLRLVSVFTILTLASTWLGPLGPRAQSDSFSQPKISKEAQVLRDNTAASSRVLALGCDWDPTIFYHAERTGLMIPGWYTAGDSLWQVENIRAYTHVITCGDVQTDDIDVISELKLRELAPGFLYSVEK